MKRTSNHIYGMTMRPVSITEEENIIKIHSSDLSVHKDFMQHYRNHIAGQQIVAECAKIYILNNWQKITDWTALDVVIEDNSKQPTDYYNYKSRTSKNQHKNFTMIDVLARLDKENKERHNPITSIKDVVLDPTDGDFSLTINEKEHMWISDDSVIIIAEFIENELQQTINIIYKKYLDGEYNKLENLVKVNDAEFADIKKLKIKIDARVYYKTEELEIFAKKMDDLLITLKKYE